MSEQVRASGNTAASSAPLLEVRGLAKTFPVRAGALQRVVGQVRAVDGVDFEVRAGETLGLVGESGCGKTTVGRLILRLIEPTGGSVLFEGTDITKLSGSQLKSYRRKAQIVFQDPMGAIDPRLPVGEVITPIRCTCDGSGFFRSGANKPSAVSLALSISYC